MKDEAFLRQKAEPATKFDFQAATRNQFGTIHPENVLSNCKMYRLKTAQENIYNEEKRDRFLRESALFNNLRKLLWGLH